jgi:hypothetical protein
MLFAQIAALAFGAIIGSQLPDIDLWLFFLQGQHRSILTHSPLIPLGVYYSAQGRMPWWHWFGAGLAAALAAHFARDMFPSMWVGFALISVPLLGRLNGTLSLLFLLASVIACWYLAVLLIRQRRDLSYLAVASLLSFGLDFARSGGAVLMPLLVLAACYLAAICVPNPVIDGRLTVQRWYEAAARRLRTP